MKRFTPSRHIRLLSLTYKSDDDSYFMELRWSGKLRCPFCMTEGRKMIRRLGGESANYYKCYNNKCRRKFTPFTKTKLSGTHLTPAMWGWIIKTRFSEKYRHYIPCFPVAKYYRDILKIKHETARRIAGMLYASDIRELGDFVKKYLTVDK